MSAKKRTARKEVPSAVAGTEVLVTVGDWLRFAVTAFSRAPLAFAQGLHGPQEEALFLVGRFLGLEQEDIPHFAHARLTAAECGEIRELVRRRIEEHVPVPYLVREAWIGGARFYVDERVLIPRSYIAELLPDAVTALGGRGFAPRRILDIGTGSGCLAILAARAWPEAVVDAVDVSDEALEVAAENVAAHGLHERVHLLKSDLFAGLPALPYDLILANPPYEPAAICDDQPAELAREPRLALDGGADGMNCVRRILAEARAHLAPRGVLVLEHGDLRATIAAEFPQLVPHVFALRDGSDAVIGVRAADLPGGPRRRIAG
jgi:ribosomal protein L3 glutamine methyltransferase